LQYKSHPWHGVEPGAEAPQALIAFIEIVPTDTVKYEIDKASGYLKIDRPQQFSNVVPALYGFIPKTYCAEAVAQSCMEATGKEGIVGDGDPLDILVLSEKDIQHGDILVRCKPIGGLRMIDDNEADDKIIAVLDGDGLYGQYHDIADLPKAIVDRMMHYFLTYKHAPMSAAREVEIAEIYGPQKAYEVITASMSDYKAHFTS
jgi:inorganic pyrophosphatase